MFGFLNIYKPKGKTSHDVVAILRRITKIKQIGHTGTLDPFAEGVLPICIGKSTRLIEYLDDEKAYIGTIQLGASTSTYDIEGEVTATSSNKIKKEDIEIILNKFRGEIEQIPPIYSAIKINGKKSYEYARNGETIELKPRKVHIEKLDIVNFDEKNQTLEILVECSKGTYIRSIANDIGTELGCYGHLIKLVRIKAGKFNIENSIALNELTTIDLVTKNLIYPTKYLNYPKYDLSNEELTKVSHGNSINIDTNNGIFILMNDNKLIAIAKVENKIAKTQKVFI